MKILFSSKVPVFSGEVRLFQEVYGRNAQIIGAFLAILHLYKEERVLYNTLKRKMIFIFLLNWFILGQFAVLDG